MSQYQKYVRNSGLRPRHFEEPVTGLPSIGEIIFWGFIGACFGYLVGFSL